MTAHSWTRAGLAALAALCISCAPEAGDEKKSPIEPDLPPKNPFPSTYEPYPSVRTAIVGATVLTGAGERIENGAVLFDGGTIVAVGAAAEVVPEDEDGLAVVDAAGKFVTPGIIDNHSHLGVYPSPGIRSTSDGNEATAPVTAEVWSEHSVWPQDPGFTRALAGGITTLQILPGSANLFGGRSVVLKNVPSRTVQGMKFPGAPYGLKMACGENPKRVYASRGPATRMGNVAGYREAWIDAQDYKRKWDEYVKKAEEGDADAKPPKRDLELETLMGVLEGEIIIHMHCYRADEMVQVLDMAEEFGYRVGTFHHAIESYKIADILGANDVCSAVWADWWGFKLEAYDTVRENAALIQAAGACATIHSDSAVGIQRLNQEAAKAMGDGIRAGIEVSAEDALSWITLNMAKSIGLEDQIGSLEAGKMADIVIWDQDPLSVYARAERVYIDGALMYDRTDPERSPRTDFEIGQIGNARTGGAGQ